LLVPSMINRWYVLDLREGVSLARALVEAGIDTWCLDWGRPEDEDRYLSWDEVIDRLHRMVRRVQRETGAPRVGLLGYCMGGTLAGIYAALEPERIAALINLAGPFDFAHGGALARMTDARWFDGDAVADAGNVHPLQMQSGFVALRPTLQIAKWVGFLDRAHDPRAREAFEALDEWAGDNIAFPAEAYRTYIRELYQQNALVQGTHHVRGRRVDLGAIHCPVLTVAAERDTICPVAAARALNDHAGSDDTELLVVPGGHVGAVIGSKAPAKLYPAIAAWLSSRLSPDLH
jgi:polyhydroxyalkanoate synthase